MGSKRVVLAAFIFSVLAVPAMAAFVPPPLTPVTPIQDSQGRFIINEGVLYQLPFPMAFESGDVILTESLTAGGISDLVRFFNNLQDFGNGAGIGNLIFEYSDTDGPPESNDNFPIPADRMFNVVTAQEANSEGGIEATPYTASLVSGASISYVLISDVPEPASLFLSGAGLLALAVLRRTRFSNN